MVAWKRLSTLLELLKLYNSWRSAARAVRAKPCWLCGASAPASGLCPPCAADLPRGPVSGWQGSLTEIEQVYAPFRYAFPIDAMIQHAKFSRDLAALHALAWTTAMEVSGHLPPCDCIVPVPLSATRYIGRGYNGDYPLATSNSLDYSPALPVNQ